DVGGRGAIAKERDDGGGDIVRVRQQTSTRVAPAFRQRLEDQALLFRPHAAQRSNPAFVRGALEIVQRSDVQLAVERCNGFGPDALQVKQIEHGRRKLGDELAVVFRI